MTTEATEGTEDTADLIRGQLIGKLVPDLIVDDRVIVDPKVVTAFNETHIAQMLGYLNITGLEVALLLNFKEAKLSCKRVVRGGPEEAGDKKRGATTDQGL